MAELKVTRETFPLLELPSGDSVGIRVVTIEKVNSSSTSTFLITANIHGDEVTGVVVSHRLIDWLCENPEKVEGKIVIIPSLNPSGLLQASRFPAFDAQDPNRTWPDSKPKNIGVAPDEPKTDTWYDIQKQVEDRTRPQNEAFNRLYAFIEDTIRPDYHVDLHTFSTISIPFIFLDRLTFNNENETKDQETPLWDRTNEFVQQLGLTVVMERPVHLYIKQKLHRSTSGTTLNKLRIPSCTIELGPMDCVPPACRSAGVSAVLNGLIHAGNITNTERFPITEVPVLRFEKPHRYLVYPLSPATGIVDFYVTCGEPFKQGETLGVIRHMNGQLQAEVKADMDGYIIAWFNGVAVHKNQPLGMVAVEDGNVPIIAAWQDLPLATFY
eukprot:CAMPEP_0206194396 /NCGR_PEP_ID=MMETSP0166-20121206/7168_1 /ASSEMBLY_ACC=CAM_ASM_000260 /TAXON_ID=95228 /ORGANISM="Vannella robusta, Strain DIVA3 518/3/11/1/6" /LENGTH=382 /DNA_ID=CAMNT_0053611353 /DNA_START=108 /DNA_END=1256 /DNA_ORIENTATION=+